MGSRQLRPDVTRFIFRIFDYLAKVVNVMILHVLVKATIPGIMSYDHQAI